MDYPKRKLGSFNVFLLVMVLVFVNQSSGSVCAGSEASLVEEMEDLIEYYGTDHR